MSLRGDIIRRARDRVDARRDARRADIRDNYRRTYSQNLGKTKLRPTKQRVGSGGDKLLEIIRGAGGNAATMVKDTIKDPAKKGINQFKDAIFPLGQKALKGIETLMANINRSKQNREILGDAYTDDVRESMMTDKDLAFYNKYAGLAELASDNQERERLMGIANTAKQNAQITNRINYALGQPEFGFETTAPAGVANIDYSTLADRMQDGLQGSSIGKAFRAEAIKAANDEKGGNLISDEIMNYRDPIMDMVAPKTPLVSQPELMNVSNQNLMPTYDYNTYGDPMDNILYGEPGSGTGSFLLQSMYPGYEEYSGYENAQKYGLENMTEKELMQFGYENPTLANMFGFNPSRFTESYYGFE